MSDVDSTTLPATLEEAISEIDSLRAQLSGSDLKVFSQIRDLRAENSQLKEKIQQLTEHSVSQALAVRGLEKNEEKLKQEIATLQSTGEELEGKCSSLNTECDDLKAQLEEHKSKELNLSQELERVTADHTQTNEELEKLQKDFENDTSARAAELEEAQKAWKDEVAAKEEAIKALEDRVEQFKEEFLSQEFAPAAADANLLAAGEAFEVLTMKMEDFLGYPGRALVEQVFRLSGVDKSSADPSELEETFEVLQDTASQLVRSEEQESELASILKDAWQEIGLAGEGDGAKAEPKAEEISEPPQTEPEVAEVEEPESAEEVVEEEKVEEEQAQEVEAPAEPGEVEDEASESSESPVEEAELPDESEIAEEVVAEADQEASEDPPVEEAPPEEAATTDVDEVSETAAGQALAEETPPDLDPVPEPTIEDDTVVPDDAAEPVAEEEQSAESDDAPEAQAVPESEEALPDELPEAPVAVEADEPEQAEAEADAETETEPEVEVPTGAADGPVSFEEAARLLDEGQHALALPMFEALNEAEPEESTYRVGRVACLAGESRYAEAYQLGQALVGQDLGESTAVYNESMNAALAGLASEADSDLVRKEFILELLLRTENQEQLQTYLDEADEIAMRISREGELSLLQAKHRVGQDDVTEYLIDALHSLSDRTDVFSLLKSNLERYPELQPLSEFLETLLDSSRAESLEAESGVKDLIGMGESVEDLLDETDPGEEAVVQVFLEHLIPRSKVEFDIPSEDFEELMLEAEPAAFVGSLRQALRSVDYTIFFDEIEVLSYDGDDHFLLRSSPEPTPTLLFGAEVDDVPPEELRFLVLRELFSMYRRHSQLAHISAGLDDERRVKLVKACIDIFSEFESQVPQETMDQLQQLEERAAENGQDNDFRADLESFLRQVYLQTESDSFLELGDFLYEGQLNRKWLDSIADGFAARQTGLVVASYSICRDQLEDEEFEQVEESGFGWLYGEDNLAKHSELRLRLQRLWSTPLKALISEPEE